MPIDFSQHLNHLGSERLISHIATTKVDLD